MKAIVYTKYGPPEVLHFTEVEKSTPKDNEVLIKVHATSVSIGDVIMRRGKHPTSKFQTLMLHLMMGIKKPKRSILGIELAGEIESIGEDVKLFKKGNQVFGSAGFKMGAYAEYICLPEQGDAVLAIKPTNVSYGEAAAIPLGGLNALYFLKKANILIGQKVLINGAGGSIGTFAVQLAKSYGAEVTGVDSIGKLEMLRSIGADKVIDYTQEDFTKSGQSYDVILDLIRNSSYSGCVNSLKKNGIYLQGNHGLFRRIRGRLTSMTNSKKVISGTISEETENLNALKELIQDAKIKSVIDKSYPLEKVVEAHRYVESGQKIGNVVIIVEHNQLL